MSLLHEYPDYLKNLGPGQAPWVYPGGEVGIRVPARSTISKCTARMQNTQDIIQFIMASRGREEGPFQDVLIPYLPYARQDRVAAPGDPNAIHVFADLIRESLVRRVFTIDAHSPASEQAFLTRGISFHNVNPLPFIVKYILQLNLKQVVLVAPDKGARDKVDDYFTNLCDNGEVVGIVYCQKMRDPATGKLAGFGVSGWADTVSEWDYTEGDDAMRDVRLRWPNADFVILDDICDGGGTFIGIREQVFKPEDRVHLWTTHGIYSRGLRTVAEKFTSVGSTDSFISACDFREVANYIHVNI